MSAPKVDVLAALSHRVAVLDSDGFAETAKTWHEVYVAVFALIEAAQQFKRDHDQAQADAEGEWLIQPDAGCYECTLHTVPHDKDTGLCGYHKLERALGAVP
jgi:hypothetical protein